MKTKETKSKYCPYRQLSGKKAGKAASEHQHGKRKRWYEQYYPALEMPSLPKNKLGWAFRRVGKGKKAKPIHG